MWSARFTAKAVATSYSAIFPAERHFEFLTLPELLKSICRTERIFHVVGLKYVEASVEEDFPAVFGDDVAGVEVVTEFPVEDHADRADVFLDL